MKKEKLFQGISYIPVLLWMGFIFTMSSQNGNESTKSSGLLLTAITNLFGMIFGERGSEFATEHGEILTVMIRKGAHMTEYAILFLLLWQTALSRKWKKKKLVQTAVICVCLCGVYAASDECHQLFVSDRFGSVMDVLIDTLGATIMALIAVLAGKRKKKKQNEKIYRILSKRCFQKKKNVV